MSEEAYNQVPQQSEEQSSEVIVKSNAPKSLLEKLRVFIKDNWLVLALIFLAVWWFCIREESKLDMFKDLGSSGSVMNMESTTMKLAEPSTLTTTPTGLASFLRG
jgi:hypothetical protein